jgi:hypothetical protein
MRSAGVLTAQSVVLCIASYTPNLTSHSFAARITARHGNRNFCRATAGSPAPSPIFLVLRPRRSLRRPRSRAISHRCRSSGAKYPFLTSTLRSESHRLKARRVEMLFGDIRVYPLSWRAVPRRTLFKGLPASLARALWKALRSTSSHLQQRWMKLSSAPK